MNTTLTRRLTAASMAAAAVLAIAGFTALGSIFDYPKILRSPAADILASYRQHDTAISAWFVVLVLSAVLIPLGLDIARLTNFAGYVTWCAWLVAMAIMLWRNNPAARASRGRAARAYRLRT
jgi:hypothetical protein